jgi:hypothetical protein
MTMRYSNGVILSEAKDLNQPTLKTRVGVLGLCSGGFTPPIPRHLKSNNTSTVPLAGSVCSQCPTVS